jgi:biopolymer transport protein ExbD/biopolymer transport protein TolR
MPDADKEDAILIAVTRDNKDYLGNDQIAADQLSDKVRDRLANKTDKRVYVKSDARAKYGTVVAVVDNVRSAGVDQLGLLTEQRQPLADRKNNPPTGQAGGE